MKKFDKEIYDEFKRLKNINLNTKQIKKLMNLKTYETECYQVVYKKENLLYDKETLSKIKNIENDYIKGLKLNDIANKHSVSTNFVDKVLFNIVITDMDLIFNRAKNYSKVKKDFNAFKNINDKETCYWAGLIYSDGWIMNDTLNIQLKDSIENKNLLMNFKNYLKTDAEIRPKQDKYGNKGIVLRICSKEIIYNIKNNFNIYQNKTYLEFKDFEISKECASHFCRGVFCGDGTATKNNVSICSRTRGILDFINKFSPIKCKIHFDKSSGGIWRSKLYSLFDQLVFLDWLYNDSNKNIRLSRKYDQFLAKINLAENQSIWVKPIINYIKQNIDPKEYLNNFLQELKTKYNHTNHAPNKLSNNSKINQKIATKIRNLKNKSNLTNQQISDKLNISINIINDVILGRTWIDNTYNPTPKLQTKYYNYNNQNLTLTEISKLSGIPKGTIDDRLRKGLTIEEATSAKIESKPYNLPEISRTGLTKEIVTNIRTDYYNGLKGDKLYQKYSLTKSRAMDILLNRTWKEEAVWWKSNI